LYINGITNGSEKKFFRSHLVSERFLLLIIKVLASDIGISRFELTNIKRFLEIIDRDYYSVSPNIIGLILVCDLLVSIRSKSNTGPNVDSLVFKINNMLVEPYDQVRDNLIIPQILMSKDEVPEADLEFVSLTIDRNLKYDYILSSKNDLVDLANSIDSCSFTDFPEQLDKFRELLTDMINYFRATDSSDRVKQVVHTSDDSFIDMLMETYKTIMSPSTALQTGWQALNIALGPRRGFVNKNAYIFHANTNSFKSALLLHIARMLKTYNVAKLMEIWKSTGRTPTILFIELENDFDEDTERLFKIVVKKDIDKVGSKEELEKIWNSEFNTHMKETEDGYDIKHPPIDISFVHADAMGITVEGIDALIDTVQEEGFQVVACIIDYLGLIGPRRSDINRDTRIQLAHIANDLLSLAKNRDIPVITAHQINRSGGAVLTNYKTQGGMNAVANLTNEFIGEAYAIEQAVSWSAFIDIEDHDSQKYLTFKLNKSRKRRSEDDMFVMPIHDGIIIDDDIYSDTPNSFDKIPNESVTNNPDGNVMGKRGIIDIRDEETRKRAKLANEIKVEKQEVESISSSQGRVSLLDFLDFRNWFQYIESVGLDNIATFAGGFDMNCNKTETIGETEYVFLDRDVNASYF